MGNAVGGVLRKVNSSKDLEICQIFYHSIDGDYTSYEGGKYQANQDIQTSMLHKDFKED